MKAGLSASMCSLLFPAISLEEAICVDTLCDTMDGKVLIYRDSGHLSAEGSAYIGQKMSLAERVRQEAR